MRQFAVCGYCGDVLNDAFHVDHKDENHNNDQHCNLCACCASCHALKTMHYRKKREHLLQQMLQSHDKRHTQWRAQWAEPDAHWLHLPRWLRDRVTPQHAQQQHWNALPKLWEQFRFQSAHAQHPHGRDCTTIAQQEQANPNEQETRAAKRCRGNPVQVENNDQANLDCATKARPGTSPTRK